MWIENFPRVLPPEIWVVDDDWISKKESSENAKQLNKRSTRKWSHHSPPNLAEFKVYNGDDIPVKIFILKSGQLKHVMTPRAGSGYGEENMETPITLSYTQYCQRIESLTIPSLLEKTHHRRTMHPSYVVFSEEGLCGKRQFDQMESCNKKTSKIGMPFFRRLEW